jgi:translation initiation factor IF-2
MRFIIRTLLAVAVGAAMVASGSAVLALAAPAAAPMAAPTPAVDVPAAPPAPPAEPPAAVVPAAPPAVAEVPRPPTAVAPEIAAQPVPQGRQTNAALREAADRPRERAAPRRSEPAEQGSASLAPPAATRPPSPTAAPPERKTEKRRAPGEQSEAAEPSRNEQHSEDAPHRPVMLGRLPKPLLETCDRMPVVGPVCGRPRPESSLLDSPVRVIRLTHVVERR